MTEFNEKKLKNIVDYNEKIIEGAGGDINNVVAKLITVEYQGHTIWNPFKDETLRYEVNPYEKYGLEKIRQLISNSKNK